MVLQEGFWPGKKSLFSGTQVPPVSQIDTVQRLRDGKTECAEKNVYDDASICFFDEPESLPCSSLTGRIPSV